MKQYIGIIRDHSGSMGHLEAEAMQDYNSQIDIHKSESFARDIETIVSVVEVGRYPEDTHWSKRGSSQLEFRRDVVNSDIRRLKKLTSYPTPGGSTPLFAATNDLIDILESAPDRNDKDVAFLVLVITDGQENVSLSSGTALGRRIKQLQGTDKWTFTFRVPFGQSYSLANLLGIPAGNILEWEQTRRGFEQATRQTVASTQAYYGGRAMGQTASVNFYADPGKLSQTTVKRKLDDITSKVKFFKTGSSTEQIRPFVERMTKRPYEPGNAFYQLVKTEGVVQSYKAIIIRDRNSDKFYGGEEARDLLGLPKSGSIKLSPGQLGQYDVFVQSRSVNRNLVPYTGVVVFGTK